MAIAVALDTTVLPNPLDKTSQLWRVHVTLTFTGSFASHGDSMVLSGLGVPSDQLPVAWQFFEATPAANKPAYGAAYVYLPGTTVDNGVLEFFNGTTELTASTATYASLSLPTNFAVKGIIEFPVFL